MRLPGYGIVTNFAGSLLKLHLQSGESPSAKKERL